MNSETMILSKFFENYYIIPDYQRGYSWQDKQIEDFWEDITSAIEKKVKHYFGTVYLKLNCERYRKKYYDVIDGQQRLTTLFVLLKILEINNLIINEQVYHLDYDPDNPNRDFFINRIIEGNGHEKIINCYRKNLDNLKKNLSKRVESYGEEGLTALKAFLVENLIIDVRYIGNDEDGITDMVVFETLNNRGKPLSILEKLKNRLMNLDSINKFDLKDTINECWANIYKELGKIKDKYINKNISIDDDFVSAHLTIYRRSENTTFSIKGAEEKLFQMFCHNPEKFPLNERSNLEEWNTFSEEQKNNKGREDNLTSNKIKNYIDSLKRFCSKWVEITNFCNIGNENIKKCLMLDSSKELKILLTTLLMKYEQHTDEIFKLLPKVLFRQNLPNEWNRTWDFATLAYYFNNQDKQISYEGVDYTIDLKFLRSEYKNIIKEELDLESISDGFKNYYTSGKGAAGFYKWKSIKYFLYEYDKQLKGNGCDIPYEDIEVEHIIPQNPSEWGIDTTNRISKNVLINTLGNLTILHNSKNHSIGNNNWEDKKNAYSTDSTKSEKEILQISNQFNDEWNNQCIGNRSENMFEFFKNIIMQYGQPEGIVWDQYDFTNVKRKILYYDGTRERPYQQQS